MIVTIHQPEHMPWLGFFDKMRQVDTFVLLDTTQYARRDFQNRNRIKTKTGPSWLTVPVINKGRYSQRIVETKICNERDWARRCKSMIRDNYSKAPYFDEHWPFFDELYSREWTGLVELNIEIINYLAAQLEMNTRLVRASELGVDELGANKVLLTICRTLGAQVYLSGRCGRDYLDESQFLQNHIQVAYQEFEHPVYPQIGSEFLSHMSTIDLLFNCGRASKDVLAVGKAVSPSFDEQPTQVAVDSSAN